MTIGQQRQYRHGGKLGPPSSKYLPAGESHNQRPRMPGGILENWKMLDSTESLRQFADLVGTWLMEDGMQWSGVANVVSVGTCSPDVQPDAVHAGALLRR